MNGNGGWIDRWERRMEEKRRRIGRDEDIGKGRGEKNRRGREESIV